jgi:hypothetical protein
MITDMNITQIRTLRKKAKKNGQTLYVTLSGRSSPVVALTDCAMPYGSPGFRCEGGDGWYPLNGAEFTFDIR